MKYLVGITLEVQIDKTLETSGKKDISKAIAQKLNIPLGPDGRKQIAYIYDEDDECIFGC